MYSDIFTHLERPEIYKQSETNFWNDEHISKHMLKAHLDPDFEGASRRLSFIDESVKWICETVPSSVYPRLLDVGCGPGLYAERFYKAGYNVTGIDFSKRSLKYAVDSASKQRLDIFYLYQDYLKMDYDNVFDFAAFIYCDYGALSTENRKIILRKIYRSLKNGGKLLLDVFSMVKYDRLEELKNWQLLEDGGFWSAEKHLELHTRYKYSENVTLDQTHIITDNGIKDFYIWDRYYTPETLLAELYEAGFKKPNIYGDVTGKPYNNDSPTIAILLEK